MLAHEVLEDIATCDGDFRTARVLRQTRNETEIGFFAIPVSPDSHSIRLIFFTNIGIVRRTQLRPLGEILRDEGMVSETHVREALNEQQRLKHRKLGEVVSERHGLPREKIEDEIFASKKAKKTDIRVGNLLVAAELITQSQLQEALDDQRASCKKPLGKILVERGMVTEEQLLTALALKFRLRMVDLDHTVPEPLALSLVPRKLALELNILPISADDACIVAATSDPTDPSIIDTLAFRTNRRPELVVAPSNKIADMIQKHYVPDSHMSDIDIDKAISAEKAEQVEDDIQLLDEAKQGPIIKLANNILVEGMTSDASDIHILPMKKDLKIAFRIDGMLRERHKLDHRLHKSLIARIKIISGMDVTEHRKPQDGRINLKSGDQRVEFRVSCMPGLHGEHMVLRILRTRAEEQLLDELGLSDANITAIRQIARAAHGMLLITGPTGSGKSTTMMAIMQDLTREPKHLLSLEDPIEREIEGVNQIQINDKIGFTFAAALRNALRHDPDVIMLGEVRDIETLKTAMSAATTGHVLISSIHTNTAVGTFDRIIQMGIEPYLVAATVRAVLNQRLIPKLCEHCKQPHKVSDEVQDSLSFHGIVLDEGQVDYKADGCDLCMHTGYAGRVMCYEFLHVDAKLRALISRQVSEHELVAAARAAGMQGIKETAMQWAQKGIVSLKDIIPLFMG